MQFLTTLRRPVRETPGRLSAACRGPLKSACVSGKRANLKRKCMRIGKTRQLETKVHAYWENAPAGALSACVSVKPASREPRRMRIGKTRQPGAPAHAYRENAPAGMSNAYYFGNAPAGAPGACITGGRHYRRCRCIRMWERPGRHRRQNAHGDAVPVSAAARLHRGHRLQLKVQVHSLRDSAPDGFSLGCPTL
jgi:hypothetical protein